MDKLILNSKELTQILGYWPTFEDCEIVSIRLDRSGHGVFRGPTVDTVILVPDIPHRPLLVTIRFQSAENVCLSEFDGENALSGISVVDLARQRWDDVKLEVHFHPSSGGMGIKFLCKSAIVLAVEPADSR